MAKRTMWKTVITVFAVVIAGIVYCVFFAEEEKDTVLYQTGNTAEDEMPDTKAQENKEQINGITADDTAAGKNNGNGEKMQHAVDVILQEEAGLIYVHVCGAVKNPGVYAVSEGARVCDVIAKAGGLMEHAADDYVNQARALIDGERVFIPEKDELSSLSVTQYAAGQPVSDVSGGQNNGTAQKNPVNINTATLSELMTLPGIGESRAESIIAYREVHGTFSKIEDIMKISGIKAAAYEKIKDRICTGNE